MHFFQQEKMKLRLFAVVFFRYLRFGGAKPRTERPSRLVLHFWLSGLSGAGTKKTASLILTLVFLFFQTNFAYADFNPPGSAPPAGNVPAPLYSSGNEQLTGNLTVTAASGAAVIGQGGSIGIQGNGVDGNGVFGQLTTGGAGGGRAIYGLAVDANDYSSYISGGLGLGVASGDIWFLQQGGGISWPRESDGAGLYGIVVDASGQLQIRGHGGGIAFMDQTTAIKVLIEEDGDVGIGTPSPGAKLEVAGQIKITGGSPGLNKVLTSQDGSGLASWVTPVGLPSGTSGQTLRHNGTSWTANSTLYNNGTNVGVGTTGPGAKLNVEATTQQLRLGYNSTNYASFTASASGDLTVNTTGGDVSVTDRVDINYNSNDAFQVKNGAIVVLDVDTTNARVGIGTGSPNETLEVTGGGTTRLRITDVNAGENPELQLKYGNSPNDKWAFYVDKGDVNKLKIWGAGGGAASRLTFDTAGNIGVGTASPGAKLEVAGQIKITGGSPGLNKVLTSSDASGLASWVTPVGLPSGSSGQTLRHDGSGWVANSNLYNDGTNVAVGTVDPQGYRLWVGGDEKVAGNLSIDGAIDVSGGDVAEEFRVERIYEPGTVLVIGDGQDKSAKASSKEYDAGVIGVVSSEPAVVIGRVEGEKKVVVAMIGVVKVKVAGYNGSIKKGDLLTTSGAAGYAMKASKIIPGTIIGKALQDFSGVRGEILVLVNLQ